MLLDLPTNNEQDERTAAFANLSLSDHGAPHNSAAQLLLWPKYLTQFLFTSFAYNSPHFTDSETIRAMLLPHRETLKRVDIGYQRHPHRQPDQLLDVSDFPKLERLGLSRRQMPEDLELSAAEASLLLALLLKTFAWDLSMKDCYGIEASYNFGEKEETWLREFLRMAVKRDTALKNVVVDFGRDPWSLPSTKEGQGEGTWDRLGSLKKEFRPHGVTVTYPEP